VTAKDGTLPCDHQRTRGVVTDRQTDRQTDDATGTNLNKVLTSVLYSQWVHLDGIKPCVEMCPGVLDGRHTVSDDVLLPHEYRDGMNPRVKRRRRQRNCAEVRGRSAATPATVTAGQLGRRGLVIRRTRRPDDGRTISQPLEVYWVRRQCRGLQYIITKYNIKKYFRLRPFNL